MVSSILPKNERKKFDFTSMIPQVELFSFVFGRIEETINCFRDLLTFSCWTKFGNSDHCAFVNMFGFLVKNRSASNLLQCLTKAIVFELFYHQRAISRVWLASINIDSKCLSYLVITGPSQGLKIWGGTQYVYWVGIMCPPG